MPEKKNVTKQQDKRAVIYLGPVILGVTRPGTVYNNGLPAKLQEAVKEQPALSRLLVTTDRAPETQKELREPQSAVSVCYQAALEYAKKRGAKA